MTEPFDPNATPECDFNENESLFTCCDRAGSFNFARIFERQARLAEEKLRIAVNALYLIKDANGMWVTLFAEERLKEIEQVGK